MSTSMDVTRSSTTSFGNGQQTVPIALSEGKKHNPTIEDFKFRDGLPSAEELPCSDDKPVDSELQELVPGLLKAVLMRIWQDRLDYLFAIDMGLYYDPDLPCLAPDAFLSLGVEDCEDEDLRSSYVLWDEKVIPTLVLEVVSKSYRSEHSKKLRKYEGIGVLYYVVYAPLRKKKAKLEVYKLIDGQYVLQQGIGTQQRVWMPEVGLGIGYERGKYDRRDREWLFWYDEAGVRYLTPQEVEEAQAQKVKLLSERLRELGVDPDSL